VTPSIDRAADTANVAAARRIAAATQVEAVAAKLSIQLLDVDEMHRLASAE
jgi:hypothetical protein